MKNTVWVEKMYCSNPTTCTSLLYKDVIDEEFVRFTHTLPFHNKYCKMIKHTINSALVKFA